ncbi:MAG TPA: cytochrome c biogenesis heme-transporting ATPase CcmA [Steroidobacteraceae bacterium]|nr:cytochrome c biogenesis heme-transporting ATPase CcmA [Steroidobacteraceae bacterium]
MTAELRADNLHLWRGEQHVLRGVGFAARAGQCLLVTGRNGAGKTSLIRTIAGILQPEEGHVYWRGESTARDRAGFHGEMAYLGHDAPLKGDLTGAENLHFGVGVRRRFSVADMRAALGRTIANDFADRPVRTLSAGQRRRIALAGVLLTSATLWLLDEPTTNLDASGQELVTTLLAAHLAGGGIAVAAIHHPLALDAHLTTRLELT